MPTCPSCQAEYAPGSRFCPSCGAAAVATGVLASDPWIGQVVNKKFRIESLLGQGGMGRVYKATHLTLDRPVVLKMLHRGLTSDPSVVQRFHREAKAASRLVHPHSIQVLDFGEAEDGTLFMAMEYLSGRDLASILAAGGPLPEARMVRIGAQILEALGEAHAHGIIHRDLKPENVMVEDRRNDVDHVTVLDFGIAKISDPGPGEGKLTQAGLVCGTPQYMSPEQARGLELDPRSDLYAMGVILYQMATARLPFESDTPIGFLTKHIAEPPAPMRQRYPALAVSPRFEALVARALAKDPAGRPASADAMRAELLACGGTQAGAPARREPEPRPVPPAPPRRRSAGPAVVVVLLLLLAGGGAAAYLALRRPGEAGAGVPRPQEPVARQDPPSPLAPPRADGGPPGPDGKAASQEPGKGDDREAGAGAPRPEGPAAEKGGPRKKVALARPDPARARALFEQAEERRKAMDAQGAIALYLKAERADPGLAEVHKKLGQCYQLVGDIPRARERYRRYLATGPPDADRVRASLDLLR